MKSPSAITYIRLMRPRQWAKNMFVFAPLIFARELFFVHQALLALQGFIAFSLAASVVYVINDIVDAPADRLHPEKRKRPIAAGAVTVPRALVFAGLLLLLLVAATLGLDVRFVAVVGMYILMNVFYTYWLKRVVLLDVFVIAAGFMLRVVGGAFVIQVGMSSWLVLCSLFISLFLGFAKRRAEILRVHNDEVEIQRQVLTGYSVSFLDQMITITGAGAVISYALYTVAPRTVEIFGTEKLIYTTIFVCYGVFRYLFLTHRSVQTENPTNLITSDRVILITGLLWIVSCILIIYQGGKIRLT
ncbi:MAG: decaprenyl-phosphate phosphoribosyltransferase [Bacteroidota bacterium]